MLGLIDRARIIDLFDAVMAGDAAARHQGDREPARGGRRSAHDPDRSCRFRALGDAAQGGAGCGRAMRRAAKPSASAAPTSPQRIAMPHLARAWQMLLKGSKEVELHGDPLMAAEMVLIRLAYAADLPSGEELVKLAREGGACREQPAPSPKRHCDAGASRASG